MPKKLVPEGASSITDARTVKKVLAAFNGLGWSSG